MIKDSLKVLAGTAVSQIFTVLKTFLIIRYLNPETYGLWNLFTVVLSYTLWFELGVLSGMDKLIPFLRGQSNEQEAVRTRNTAITALLILYLFISSLFILLPGSSSTFVQPGLSRSIQLLGFIVFLSGMQNVFVTVSRAEKKFGIISMTSGLFSVSLFGFLLLLYRIMGDKLEATLLSFILAHTLALTYCATRLGWSSFRLEMSARRIRHMVNTGFPLILIGIGFVLFTSVDRWILAKLSTKTELGSYAFGFTIGTLLYSLTSIVAYVFYPRMLEKVGKGFEFSYFFPDVKKVLLILSYVVATGICLIMTFLPLICSYFFPLYSAALNFSDLLLAGFFFLSIATVCGNFLVAVNKQTTILKLQISGILVVAVIDYLILIFWGNAAILAFSSACIFSIYGASIIFFSFRWMQCPRRDAALLILKFSIPLIVSILLTVSMKAAANTFANPFHILIIFGDILCIILVFIALFAIQNGSGSFAHRFKNLRNIVSAAAEALRERQVAP